MKEAFIKAVLAGVLTCTGFQLIFAFAGFGAAGMAAGKLFLKEIMGFPKVDRQSWKVLRRIISTSGVWGMTPASGIFAGLTSMGMGAIIAAAFGISQWFQGRGRRAKMLEMKIGC